MKAISKYWNVVVLGVPIDVANRRYQGEGGQPEGDNLPPQATAALNDKKTVCTRRLLTYAFFILHAFMIVHLVVDSPVARYQRFQDEVYWLDVGLGNMGGCNLLAGDDETVALRIQTNALDASSSGGRVDAELHELSAFEVFDCALNTDTARGRLGDGASTSYRLLRRALKAWARMDREIREEAKGEVGDAKEGQPSEPHSDVGTLYHHPPGRHMQWSLQGQVPSPALRPSSSSSDTQAPALDPALVPSYVIRTLSSIVGTITFIPEPLSAALGIDKPSRRLSTNPRMSLVETLKGRYEVGGDLAEAATCPYVPGEALMPQIVLRRAKFEESKRLGMRQCSFYTNNMIVEASSQSPQMTVVADNQYLGLVRRIQQQSQNEQAEAVSALDMLLQQKQQSVDWIATPLDTLPPAVAALHTNLHNGPTATFESLREWMVPHASPVPTTTLSSTKVVSVLGLTVPVSADLYHPLGIRGQSNDLRTLLERAASPSSSAAAEATALHRFHVLVNELHDTVQRKVRTILQPQQHSSPQIAPSDVLVVDLRVSPDATSRMRKLDDWNVLMKGINDGNMRDEFGPHPPLRTTLNNPSTNTSSSIGKLLMDVPVEPLLCYVVYRTLMSAVTSRPSGGCSRYFGAVSFVPSVGLDGVRPEPMVFEPSANPNEPPLGMSFRARCHGSYRRALDEELKRRVDVLLLGAKGTSASGSTSGEGVDDVRSSLFMAGDALPLGDVSQEEFNRCTSGGKLDTRGAADKQQTQFTFDDLLRDHAINKGETDASAFLLALQPQFTTWPQSQNFNRQHDPHYRQWTARKQGVELFKFPSGVEYVGDMSSLAENTFVRELRADSQGSYPILLPALYSCHKVDNLDSPQIIENLRDVLLQRTFAVRDDGDDVTVGIPSISHLVQDVHHAMSAPRNSHEVHHPLLSSHRYFSLIGDVMVVPVPTFALEHKKVDGEGDTLDDLLATMQQPHNINVIPASGVVDFSPMPNAGVSPPSSSSSGGASKSSIEGKHELRIRRNRMLYRQLPSQNERAYSTVDTFPSRKFSTVKFLTDRVKAGSHFEVHSVVRSANEAATHGDLHPYGALAMNDLGNFAYQTDSVTSTRPLLSLAAPELQASMLHFNHLHLISNYPDQTAMEGRAARKAGKPNLYTASVELESISKYDSTRRVLQMALYNGRDLSSLLTEEHASTHINNNTAPSLMASTLIQGVLGASHPRDAALPNLIIGTHCSRTYSQIFTRAGSDMMSPFWGADSTTIACLKSDSEGIVPTFVTFELRSFAGDVVDVRETTYNTQ